MLSTRQSILQALREIRLIDPHSHINPHQPGSTTLADIMGYHYYTELVHSAGTPKHAIESPGITPRELVGTLVTGLPHLSNTTQHAWLIDLCQRFFGFQDDVINESNWESLFDAAESTMAIADWADVVLEKSNVEAVFLTNDFDDDLEGFDTKTYIPCLRTDDLVFHLSKIEVRDRLAVCSGIDIDGSLKSLRDAIEQRFEHFVAHGARACAISLPPDFSPAPVSDGRASTALDAVIRLGTSADASHKSALAKRVFWTIVELCDQYHLPMDLMIGVNRDVYTEGVYQGRDLYDSRVSLIQYRELFNTFPNVKFPVSVLASVTNQELVSYAWIFPNVITNGHWWYSNTPSFIRRDAAARLEAVPRNKQIGYYSDAYKLEFIAPKFEMYRNILAGILTDDFVIERGWSEEKAIELGRQILRGNVDTVFPDLAVSVVDIQPHPANGSREHLGMAATAIATPIAIASAFAASSEMFVDDVVEVADDVSEPIAASPAWLTSPEIDEEGDAEAGYPTPSDLNLEAPSSSPPAEPDDALMLMREDEPLEFLDEETNDSSDNDFVVLDDNDEKPAKTTDIYSTLELDEPMIASSPSELPADTSDWFTGPSEPGDEPEPELDAAPLPWIDDEPIELLPEETNETSENDFIVADETELSPATDDWFDGSPTTNSPPPETDVRYFRADDEPSASDTEAPHADEPPIGLYADPNTGELTWPTMPSDSESADAIEETYLLPEETPEFGAARTVSSELGETIDFEELELKPIEDDDPSMFYSDEATDAPFFFDPEQTTDFVEDDQAPETKQD